MSMRRWCVLCARIRELSLLLLRWRRWWWQRQRRHPSPDISPFVGTPARLVVDWIVHGAAARGGAAALHRVRNATLSRRRWTREVSIAAGRLQQRGGHELALALVVGQVLGQLLDLLLEARDHRRRFLFLLLAALAEAGAGASITSSLLVCDARCCLHVHGQVHRAGARRDGHHLVGSRAAGREHRDRRRALLGVMLRAAGELAVARQRRGSVVCPR